MQEIKIEDIPLINTIVEGIEDIKGEDIKILDLRHITNCVTDFFVICTGGTNTQVSAIASNVERLVRQELKDRPWHVEGTETAEWILLDYISVAVHVFQPETREYYDLDSLWGDAIVTEIPNKD